MTALTLVALLLAPLPFQEAQAFEKSGPHYKVVCHFGSEALAEQALAAAEAAWPLALEALGLKTKKVEQPLVVHLYPDAQGYEAAEQPLGGGRFKANLSFAHFETRSAHVALQPPCSEEVLRAFGLPMLTRQRVAREATHLVAYAFVPNAQSHPEWFAEGMAEDVAGRALIALGLARPLDVEPASARRVALARDLARKEKMPAATAVLTSQIGALEYDPRQAMNRLVYEFLRVQEARDLKRAVEVIVKLDGGDGYMDGLVSELNKIWKEKDRAGLDKRFSSFVQVRKPVWDEVIPALETRGEGFLQRAGARNAIAFRLDAPIEQLPATVTGTLHIWPASSHQLNFLLGRTEKGFLQVGLHAAPAPGVSVFRCDYDKDGLNDRWTLLGSHEASGVRAGADVPFRIEVTPAELTVFVGESLAVQVELEGRSPLGPWGLGALAGSTGEWKSVAVRSGP